MDNTVKYDKNGKSLDASDADMEDVNLAIDRRTY